MSPEHFEILIVLDFTVAFHATAKENKLLCHTSKAVNIQEPAFKNNFELMLAIFVITTDDVTENMLTFPMIPPPPPKQVIQAHVNKIIKYVFNSLGASLIPLRINPYGTTANLPSCVSQYAFERKKKKEMDYLVCRLSFFLTFLI